MENTEINIIKYGMNINNTPKWGFKEAIREVVQNFLDFGDYKEFETDLFDDLNGGYIEQYVYSNNYIPKNLKFLQIGFSEKHGNSKARGEHGEGLKLAMLILHRLEHKPFIIYPDGDEYVIIRPTIYLDKCIGDCFGIKVARVSEEYVNEEMALESPEGFSFYFKKPTFFEDVMLDYFVKEEDVIFSCDYGEIVNKPNGNIYVGGIYVTTKHGIERAYYFHADAVDLGRDRDFPNSYQIDLNTSYVFQEYVNEDATRFENYTEEEVKHITRLPKEITSKVEPTMYKGKLVYELEGIHLSDNIVYAVKKDPEIQEKTKRITVDLNKRKSLKQLLQKFYKMASWCLTDDMKNEFKIILDRLDEEG